MKGQLIINDKSGLQDALEYKTETAIERLRHFEPAEGYYMAFSGGKDSCVIKALADMSGVKYDAHYAVTGVDPPELTKFIKQYHPEVERMRPASNMWDLIVSKRVPPTRIARYCCEALKEEGGRGRFVITGIRWAESTNRQSRKIIDFDASGSLAKAAISRREEFYRMNDNNDKRRMIETCVIKGKNILNPIIDWSDEEVWMFIREHQIEYCSLYDGGFQRIGCIGCPFARDKRKHEFERYPWIRAKYIAAFEKMIAKRLEDGLDTTWATGQEVFDWWMAQ